MDPAMALYQEALQLQQPMRVAQAKGDSVIQQWYGGKTAFVTGGSGYLGKLLIEKLIRSCKLRRIYLLIREKKGKLLKNRLEELVQDPVFNSVREDQPAFADIIHGIHGDVAKLGLGISAIDRETLIREVDVIFHFAAITRFDEPLKQATIINVRGTRELIALAKDCINLKSLVHVSTTYAHTTEEVVNNEIWEQFYESPVAPDALIRLVESTQEKRLEAITKDFIAGWPNTYTFTKAVSEELVRSCARELPICIFRPAIVICSYYEPEPGYLDTSCAYGATGIVLGIGMAMLRVLFVRRQVQLCCIPADFTSNATIACVWKTAVSREDRCSSEPKIYSLSSSRCHIGFNFISDFLDSKGRYLVSPKTLWYNCLIETDNKVYHKVCVWLLHFFPACVVDGICKIFNIKPLPEQTSFVKIYTKIEKMNSALSYFLTKEWFIRDDNLTELYENLSLTDKDLFCFDITKVDWKRLILLWWLGIRKHLLKDGLEGSVYANKKQFYFKLANYAIISLFLCPLWMLFSRVIRRLI